VAGCYCVNGQNYELMDKRQYDTLVSVSLLVLDAFMIMVAFILGYYLRSVIPIPNIPDGLTPLTSYASFIAVQVGAILIVFYLNRLYHVVRMSSRVDLFYRIFSGVSIGALLAIAVSTMLFQNTALEVEFSRAIQIYAWVLAIALVTFGRWLHQKVRIYWQARGVGLARLLIVGTGDVARVVVQKVNWSPYLGYELVGLVDGEGGPQQILGVPVLGTTDALQPTIDEYEVDEVILALPDAPHDELLEIIARCQRGRVSIKVFPDVFEIMAGEVSVDDLGGLPLLTVRDVALRGWRLSLKRAMDVVVAAIALIVLSPIMMLVAFLVKMESAGDVFFIQERVGLDGSPFKLIKFRSMCADAEQISTWTVKDDPRRTRLGRLIRRFYIDELPQFINVLIGDMSLVGPRPEQPEFVEQFSGSIPRYMERHREKAGVTGWAQVNGLHGDTSIEERTKYDLWYIEHWSLWMDVKILVRTLFQAAGAGGY